MTVLNVLDCDYCPATSPAGDPIPAPDTWATIKLGRRTFHACPRCVAQAQLDPRRIYPPGPAS